MAIQVERNDHRLYVCSAEEAAELAPLLEERRRANQEYLAAHPAPAPKKPITGSFIYAHAPDYLGLETLHFTAADWRKELQKLIAKGIDTVIFQAAVWNELRECYYPSRYFHDFRQWNVVAPLVEAASGLPLELWLGGYGTIAWGLPEEDSGEAAVQAECERHLACFRELLPFYRQIKGVYFSPEPFYHGYPEPQRAAALNRVFRCLTEAVKRECPDLQTLISPVSAWYAGKQSEMIDFWKTALDGCAIDVVAPQDSVGTLMNHLGGMEEMLSAWQTICRAGNRKLWSNVELFTPWQVDVAEKRFLRAPEERLQMQMAIGGNYAEKLICWEALTFDLPRPRQSSI